MDEFDPLTATYAEMNAWMGKQLRAYAEQKERYMKALAEGTSMEITRLEGIHEAIACQTFDAMLIFYGRNTVYKTCPHCGYSSAPDAPNCRGCSRPI
jgi:ribosomal protein L40E